MNNIKFETSIVEKQLNGLKLYNSDAYNQLISIILPSINIENNNYSEINIPVSELFSKMYGNVTLKYTINEEKNIVINSIEPHELFENANSNNLVEYNGIMISKDNYENDKAKVDSFLNNNSESNNNQNSSNTTSDEEDEENTINNNTNNNESNVNPVSNISPVVGKKSNISTATVSIPKTLDLAIKNNYSFESGTLVSDSSLIYSAMNDIQNSISEYVNGTMQSTGASCQSDTTIPRNLFVLQTDMISSGMTLSNKLNYETSLISNIAEVIYEMDRDLAIKGNNLSSLEQKNILYSSNIISQAEALINYKSDDVVSFKTNLFPMTNTEGTIGKICLDDINTMLSGNNLSGSLAQNFDYERSSSNLILNKLNDFMPLINKYASYDNNSNNIWTNVGNKMNDYCELLRNRIKANDELEAAYINALSLIRDYMGEYTELDDSKLPELREEKTELEKQIGIDNSIVNNNDGSYKIQKDENNEEEKIWVAKYSKTEKDDAKSRVSSNKTKLEKVKEEIELLEGLPEIMNKAEEIINEAYDNIKKYYCNEVSNITTGKDVTYIPVNIEDTTILEKTTVVEEVDNSYDKGNVIGEVSNGNTKLTMYKTEKDGVVDYYYYDQDLADKYGIFIKQKEYQQRAWNSDVNSVASWWAKRNGGFGFNGCYPSSYCEAISNVLQTEVSPVKYNTTKLAAAFAKENGCEISMIKSGNFNKEVVIEILEQGGQIIHSKSLKGQEANGHMYVIAGYNEETDTFLTFDPFITQTERTNKPQNIITGTGYHEFTWDEYVEDRNGSPGGQITIISKDPIILSNNTDDNPKNDINITVK